MQEKRSITAAPIVLISILSLVGLLIAPAASGRTASLDQQKATLQFKGTMLTVWSFPPTEGFDDGCYVATESGSGMQRMEYETRGHAAMNIVDSGGNIAFQLEPRERAAPNRRAVGFKLADAVRRGSIKTVYDKSRFWDPFCYSQPEETFADRSGCRAKLVPWDAQPFVVDNKFRPQVSAFLPSSMLARCPFFGPEGNNGDQLGSMPETTQEHLPVAEVRRVLGRKHGKLIIHGKQRWRTESVQGSYEVTATTEVTWKAILIRAHP